MGIIHQGLKIDHTGFCLGDFDIPKCGDCPTLKKCLLMYARDLVKKGFQVNHALGFVLSIADELNFDFFAED